MSYNYKPFKRACLDNDFYTAIQELQYMKKNNNANFDIPFIYACEHGHIDIVKYFVENGYSKFRGLNIIDQIIDRNLTDMMKYLLSTKQFNIYIDYNNLIRILKKNNIDLIKYIIQQILSNVISSEDRILQKFLERMYLIGHLELVKFLNQCGLYLDTDIIELSANSGNFELVQYVCEETCNLRVLTNDNYLMKAIAGKNLQIVKFFIEKGCSFKDNKYLCQAVSKESYEIVNYLISAGVELNSPGENINNSPLSIAIGHQNLDLFKLLVESGCKTSQKLVKEAISQRALDILKFLIEKINYKIKDKYLSLASRSWNLKLIEYMINQGVDIKYNNYESYKYWLKHYPTAVCIIQMLIKKDINIVGVDIKSLYKNAKFWNDTEIINIVESYAKERNICF